MTDAPPLASFHLPTARAVARAWRRAYITHAHAYPYSAACQAAEAAYRTMHPRATDAEARVTAGAIMAAVEREHGKWLHQDLPPRPHDAKHHHIAYQQRYRRTD